MTKAERGTLEEVIRQAKPRLASSTHARTLLKADQSYNGPVWEDKQIGEAMDVSVSTVEWVRQRFVEESLEAALHRHPSASSRQRKMDSATAGLNLSFFGLRLENGASTRKCGRACLPLSDGGAAVAGIVRFACASVANRREDAEHTGGGAARGDRLD